MDEESLIACSPVLDEARMVADFVSKRPAASSLVIDQPAKIDFHSLTVIMQHFTTTL